MVINHKLQSSRKCRKRHIATPHRCHDGARKRQCEEEGYDSQSAQDRRLIDTSERQATKALCHSGESVGLHPEVNITW